MLRLVHVLQWGVELARWLAIGFLVGMVLSILVGCAAAPKPVVVAEDPLETGRLALARLLTDACTSEETTDERVMVVDFILKTCHGSAAACLRRACLAIGDEAERCRHRSSHIGTLVVDPLPLASPPLMLPDSDL